MIVRPCIFASLVCLTAACSAPSDHKDALAAFVSATSNIETALKEYDVAAATRATTLNEEDLIEGEKDDKAWIDYPSGDCTMQASACVPLLATTENSAGRPYKVESVIPNHLKAAAAISTYSLALQTLAATSSKSQVDAALKTVGESVSSLAALYPQGGAAASTVTAPTASLLSWVYGKYEDHLKMSALREATKAMDSVMHGAAQHFAMLGRVNSDANIAYRTQKFDRAYTDYRKVKSAANRAALIKAMADVHKVVSSRETTAFINIAAAHTKLKESLENDVESFADAQSMFERAAKDAEDIYKIIQQFNKDAAK